MTKSLVACETAQWSLVSVGRDEKGRPDPASGDWQVAPFRCGSWRCRVCGPVVGARDFVRVAAAAVSRPRWYYVVLTVDPSDWADPWAAFRGFYSIWQDRLRKRIERMGPYRQRVEYVMTFEGHASGWPHANVLLSSPALDALTDQVGVKVRRAGKARDGRLCRLPRWRSELVRAAGAVGLGDKSLWLEEVEDRQAVSGYLTKTAKELCGGGGKGQTPYSAPRGFRRLRSTRGTLPPTLASLRRASGEKSERAWAMTAKHSPADFAEMGKLRRASMAKTAFLERCADDEAAGWGARVRDRRVLSDIERTLAAGVEWSTLVSDWSSTIPEVRKWNEARSSRTSAGDGA